MPIRLSCVFALTVSIALSACQHAGDVEQGLADRDKLARVNTELAFQYMHENEYKIALQKLDKALKADPDYVDAHNAMGLLRSQLGQFDQAEDSFQRALRLDPLNPAALNNYGQFLCQRQRFEEGEKQFLKAIANPLYKQPAFAYSNAGTCAQDAGRIDVAESHFRTALEIDPGLAPALIQMASLSYDLGRYLPARAYLQRYLEISRHSARTLWLGIRIERELEDRDAVASYALRLEKAYPDSNEARLWLESKTP